MSSGIRALDNTVLTEFLGAEGVQELRSRVIDMIVEEIHHQLSESGDYIVSPDDIATELYESVARELKEEIKEEYKSQIITAVNEYVKNL